MKKIHRLRADLTNLGGSSVLRTATSCSLFALAGAGVLALALPSSAVAQSAAAKLPVLRSVVSGQAIVNAPAPGADRLLMTVDQSTPRAIIDWQSFNIGRDNEVQFRQPGVTSSTLNRIYDLNPSVIQGKLSANGQLFLINQNGILFDRGAQVNTQSMVASTLNITNERFLSGVLTAGGLTTAAFEGGYDDAGKTLALRPDGTLPGAIRIGGGPAGAPSAQLKANAGGSIMLFAPSIDNAGGLISAPDGQVILAAGGKAYLAVNDNASDITLRGFRVEIEAAPEGQGLNVTNLIRNAGEISADRGNISLAALAINQEGRISAKTAVQANGSIYLRAQSRDRAKAGTVNFATGSLTEISPDTADKATVSDSQDYTPFRGVVEVAGHTIANSGTIIAPGGRITLAAEGNAALEPARVYLDAGSLTSVAGQWTDVDFAKNLATFRVTSNELKNSPSQKAGILRGAEVTVDLRKDSSILALDGYRDLVPRTVAEKAAVGGELNITSTGDVVQRHGATLDASGGGYRYGDGFSSTTRLLGADGKVYDIASAPEAMLYTAQLDRFERLDERWGQTLSVANPLGAVSSYQSAYAEGKAGGVLNIGSANGLVLDGTLKGGVTIGTQQLNKAPRGATLRVGSGPDPSAGGLYNPGQKIGDVAWRQEAVDSLGANFSASSSLGEAQKTTVLVSVDQVFGPARQAADGRVETGFGTAEFNSNGEIRLPASVHIDADVGANLLLRAPLIDIAGDIRLPAGNLTLAPIISQVNTTRPELNSAIERVIVRSGAALSTAGTWINNASPDGSFYGPVTPSARLTGSGNNVKAAIDGGDLTIRIDDPLFQTRLEGGAVLDVGGGASINSARRVTAGRGGKMAIGNGAASQFSSDWLQADLLGFAAGTGGELTLNLNQAVIAPNGTEGVLPSATTRLETRLFTDHGFSKVTVNAFNEIDVADGVALALRQNNLLIDTKAAMGLPTGAAVSEVSTVETLPVAQRRPVSLTLSAASLHVAETASIATDPLGEIALNAIDTLRVDGRVSAPGGKIGLTLKGLDNLSASALHVSDTAKLSVAGTYVAAPNNNGLVQGTLYNGGTVTLAATQAGVRFDAGASIDVSGINQVVDQVGTGSSPGLSRQTLEGHAGSVLVRTQGPTTLAGTLTGQGGSESAAGGSFALEFTRPDRQPTLPDERRIVVSPNATSVAARPGTADTVLNIGRLSTGGFEKLRLLSENLIEFQGSSTLSFERGIRLDAPVLEVAGDANVRLQGSTVAMGQSLGPRLFEQTAVGPVWSLDATGTMPSTATRRGVGTLTVEAGLVDIFGNLTINGSRETRIHGDGDVRFIGRPTVVDQVASATRITQQLGWLHTAGDLEFTAAQLYPATRTAFEIVSENAAQSGDMDAGRVIVRSGSQVPGDVYSAAGSLHVLAPTIVQEGRLKAPQGEIALIASRSLELGAGSETSVASGGLTVLYGTTESGVQWRYADGAATSAAELDRVSANGKRIELRAPSVNVATGATVDLRGGGDVMAVEFVPGNGGDSDITVRDNTFAIIPKSALSTTPYDAHLQFSIGSKDPGFGFSLANGRDNVLFDSIQIGTGSKVPSGEYALLPARFALLPDAYLVQLQTGASYRNLVSGQTVNLPNGQVVAAGHRIARDTDVRESQSVGVVVLPGSETRRYSDYTLSGAALFADAASRDRRVEPAAPWDAGRMRIADMSALQLDGTFETQPASAAGHVARAAQIDIDGRQIAVVDQVGAAGLPEGYLQLSGAALSRLRGSVLLGGTRLDTENGTQVTTGADELRIANTEASAVQLPELLLAAKEGIEIAAGSVLRATGDGVGTSPSVITTNTSGAFIRLSNGDQTRLARTLVGDGRGEVRVQPGASLLADKALLVDGTGSVQSGGLLRAGGPNGKSGSVALSSGQISLGETAGVGSGTAGLVLSSADLAAYAALDELVLRGYKSIDLVGTSTLGSATLRNLTLDTPLLRGVAAGASGTTIVAGSVSLANNSDASTPSLTGSGTLSVSAEKIVIGPGNKALSGFETTRLQASQVLQTEGDGALRVAGNLQISTPLLLAGGGSNQVVSAVATDSTGATVQGAVVIGQHASGAQADISNMVPSLGGQISVAGRRVDVSTAVVARSGGITLQALGTQADDNVTLRPGALLDAAGQSKNFNGTLVAADGGHVKLESATANIEIQSGAKVDVSAAEAGGRAGHVALRGTTLALSGELAARANAEAESGSIDVDVGHLASFSALNDALNAGGFADERSVRTRSGDVAIAAADKVNARRVTVVADSGKIDVSGTVGVASANGGATIEMYAATGLNLAAGSQILAQGGDAGARGGEVRLATRSGALEFDSAATIDVRAGAGGQPGGVTFGISRDATATMNPVRLNGLIKRVGSDGQSAATVDVEATRTYRDAEVGTSLTATRISQLASDHAAFVAATAGSAPAILGGMRDENGTLASARLLGATELMTSGNLSVDANWDLTNGQWLTANNPGTLTLRAAGDLTIRDTLGGNRLSASQDSNHAIRAGDTWNIRLVAGSDLQAADPMATKPSGAGAAAAGDVLLAGANANVRTGTGRIDIAAAGDVRLDNAASAIYTAGRIGAADTEANGNNRWGIDGGGISITAGGSVIGAPGDKDLWITDWLRRPRLLLNAFNTQNFPTEWWAYRPRFQDAVGSLGGGDVEIRAGANVKDLAVMSPTAGRKLVSAGQRQIDVTGGGNVNVLAGGDVVGSAVLVGRGEGRVEAGGDIGANRPTQLYLMGVSSGGIPEGASVDLVAGGSIALQSIDNPTTLNLINSTGAVGPSFNTSRAATFFTYSANSAAGLFAKGGGISYAGEMAPTSNWRTFGASFPDSTRPSSTAFPANLAMVAFDGDITIAPTDSTTSFPSTSATVAVLAGGSVRNYGIDVSDLGPDAVVTPFRNFANAIPLATAASNPGTDISTVDILRNARAGRIVSREWGQPYGTLGRVDGAQDFAFDIQALEGSIVYSQNTPLFLPAVSRIRAGLDIVQPTLRLQNLNDDDLTQVRADSGDVRRAGAGGGIEIRGPGRLLLQAGRNIDLGGAVVTFPGSPTGIGGLAATGNGANSRLPSDRSARLTVVAGVAGDIDLSRMDAVYGELIALNGASGDILDLYRQLGTERGADAVLAAPDVASLARRDPAYARFVSLDGKAPRALKAYQDALRAVALPLGDTADNSAAVALYALLNAETDVAKLQAAGSVSALAAASGGQAYQAYAGLDERYPRVFADYVQRRSNGALPTSLNPIVLSDALQQVVAQAVPSRLVSGGDILTFQTAVQTVGGSGIDLWAPGGNVVVGLTTPAQSPVGVTTNAGGAIRSVLSGDFNINQGKVITVQGGDVLIFSSGGSIDAGRGAKTSQATSPPVRRAILDADGNQIAVEVVISASAAGSGIQSLTSDPDGLGPLTAPKAGDVYLFAPAGVIDAGEAGIRSSGNIVLNAQVVRNASDIRASGSSQGVPVATSGSIASSLASGGTNTTANNKSGEEATSASASAARAAAAAQMAKPTILVVEVLGFGDKNCKEQDKNCFAK